MRLLPPRNEETEQSLVLSLIQDLNNLFSTGLCLDLVVDRFTEDDVFGSEAANKQPLHPDVASHLNRVARKLNSDKWEIYNLC